LIDLDSSNGSYVNGELVREAVRLKDGDRIRLGILTFSFFLCRSTQTLGTVSTELLTQLEQSEALSRLPETYANLEASHARIFDTSSKVQAKIALEDTNLFPKSNQSRNELSQS
jgi:pSer/pThr/pTyr-binding forkhead associated (FHA) protein